MAELPRKITDDPYGAAILIRRLITEQGVAYWRRYLLAFVLMRRDYRVLGQKYLRQRQFLSVDDFTPQLLIEFLLLHAVP